MPFSYEAISEEDKVKIDFSAIKEPPFFNYPIDSPRSWAIDRERNVYFLRISTGGKEPDIPGTYVLIWAGKAIYMELENDWVKDMEGGFDATWWLPKLWLPDDLQPKRDEVIQLIKDALVAYGLYGRPTKAVHFEF